MGEYASRCSERPFWNVKISEQKFNTNISIFYVRTPNRAKQTFFCGLCKNDRKNVSLKDFCSTKICLFYRRYKKMLVFRKTTSRARRMSRCTCNVFCPNFCTCQMYLKHNLKTESICSREQQQTSS